MLRTVSLLALTLMACRSQIHHGLDEKDANEIVDALASRGFEVQKVPEKGKKPVWAIEVDDMVAPDALRVLSALRLPRPPRATTRDVVGQTGLIESPAAEKLRQLEAQEGDIEQNLENLDGVTSASVEIVVPAPPRPGAAPLPSKAAVLLRVRASSIERLQAQRQALQALVAASVEGLQTEDVTLMLDPVVTPSPPSPSPRLVPESRMRTAFTALAVVLLLAAFSLLAVLFRRGAMTGRSARTARSVSGSQPAAGVSRPMVSMQRRVA